MNPDPYYAKPPENAYDPNGPKAPGKPGEDEDFCPPKGGDDWVRNPNGRGNGWRDANGDVWVPTGPGSPGRGDAHGGPHWDVQTPWWWLCECLSRGKSSMNEVKIVKLEAIGVRFFSEYDESAFFDWLNKLACVQKYEGCGKILYITVNSEAVDEDALREFLALFHRYGVAMRQLVAFDRHEFAEWFHEKRAYWYSEVFEQ